MDMNIHRNNWVLLRSEVLDNTCPQAVDNFRVRYPRPACIRPC